MTSLAVRNKIGLRCLIRRTLAAVLVLALGCTQCLMADSNSWNKIRYTGGTIQAKVDPYDWNTVLTITPDAIVFVFAHRQTLRINPARVIGISYGQEAHRRVGEMVALSVMMINPLALFGLLHKSKDHFIGLQFQGDDGKPAGLLLEADKNNYRAILSALTAVTGKPVEDAPASGTKR
jgi:hypothetical protein